MALDVEERCFVLYATCVADKSTVFSDDTMAGNENRDWIAAIGGSYSPNGFWFADFLCNIAVRCCFSVGNGEQSIPYG